MKAVFADALYWIARVKPNDPWQDAARRARDALGNVVLVTTDEVLTEFLAALRGVHRNCVSRQPRWSGPFLAIPT
jgi:hypothetical protein